MRASSPWSYTRPTQTTSLTGNTTSRLVDPGRRYRASRAGRPCKCSIGNNSRDGANVGQCELVPTQLPLCLGWCARCYRSLETLPSYQIAVKGPEFGLSFVVARIKVLKHCSCKQPRCIALTARREDLSSTQKPKGGIVTTYNLQHRDLVSFCLYQFSYFVNTKSFLQHPAAARSAEPGQAPMNPATCPRPTLPRYSPLPNLDAQSCFTATIPCEITVSPQSLAHKSFFVPCLETLRLNPSLTFVSQVTPFRLQIVQNGQQPALPLGGQPSSTAPLRLLRAATIPSWRSCKLLWYPHGAMSPLPSGTSLSSALGQLLMKSLGNVYA